MPNKYYQSDPSRAAAVQRLFDVIARRYDFINDLMSLGLHRRWKRRLIHMAGQPHLALDLCCGTGDIARLYRGRVVAVDFSDEMLRVAMSRCSNRHGTTILWTRADALRLPFPDDTFDVVSVGYGLRNLAELDRGLREIGRVLKPGGRMLSLDFGRPSSPLVRGLYHAYLGGVLPVLGWWYCHDADAYGYVLESLRHYPAQTGLVPMMERAGFEACGFEDLIAGTMAINFGRKPCR